MGFSTFGVEVRMTMPFPSRGGPLATSPTLDLFANGIVMHPTEFDYAVDPFNLSFLCRVSTNAMFFYFVASS